MATRIILKRNLIFMRHAESKEQQAKILSSSVENEKRNPSEHGLSETGMKQINETVEKLKDSFPKIGIVMTSALARHMETASAFHLPTHSTSFLLEVNVGDFEEKTYSPQYVEELNKSLLNGESFYNSEKLSSIVKRIFDVIYLANNLELSENSDIVLVTSAHIVMIIYNILNKVHKENNVLYMDVNDMLANKWIANCECVVLSEGSAFGYDVSVFPPVKCFGIMAEIPSNQLQTVKQAIQDITIKCGLPFAISIQQERNERIIIRSELRRRRLDVPAMSYEQLNEIRLMVQNKTGIQFEWFDCEINTISCIFGYEHKDFDCQEKDGVSLFKQFLKDYDYSLIDKNNIKLNNVSIYAIDPKYAEPYVESCIYIMNATLDYVKLIHQFCLKFKQQRWSIRYTTNIVDESIMITYSTV